MADNVGQVLVVSCSSFLSSEDIIREMCKTEFSSPKELSNGSLIAYQWKIENKYYTADVQLCASSVSSLPPQCEFAANMNFQSVIIAFDLSEKSSFHNVKSWLPYVETQDPSVLLLLDSGKGNSSKESSKSEVVKWCLNNSFEFIEMNSEEEETEEEEDDFQEKTGIDRVVEALQCAEWPNMKMRENPRSHKSSEGTQQAKAVLSNDEKLSSNQAAAAERPPVFPLPTDDLELLSCLASDGNDNESFEELFQKLAVMKERASSLPATERKDYAEKCLEKLLIIELVLLVTNLENVEKTVAIAFWRALGGSEEEIAGLGENDGDNSEDGEK